MTVGPNLSLAMLEWLSCWGLVGRRREAELVNRYVRALRIKTVPQDRAAETLTGGNPQQRTIGKWLASQPQVLILDRPKHGVDIDAKSQVHHLIRQLAHRGLAKLVISSELPELFGLYIVAQGATTNSNCGWPIPQSIERPVDSVGHVQANHGMLAWQHSARLAAAGLDLPRARCTPSTLPRRM